MTRRRARVFALDPVLPSERQVQRSILSMCGVCFRDVFITAVPNGAHLAGNDLERGKLMGALKGDGLKVGFPDLLFMWSTVVNAQRFFVLSDSGAAPLDVEVIVPTGCVIEVKRPKMGRLTEDQIKCHEKLRAIPWPVAVCDNTEDAYNFLIECGAPCSAHWQKEPF